MPLLMHDALMLHRGVERDFSTGDLLNGVLLKGSNCGGLCPNISAL